MKKIVILLFAILPFAVFSQILATTASGDVYSDTPTTLYDNVAAWYDFNEPPGTTTLIDASGNGLNGTITGATLAQSAQVISDSAHLYIGTNKSIVPDTSLLVITSDSCTVAAWIYITSLYATNTIAEKLGEYIFYVNNSGKLGFAILDGETETSIGRTTDSEIIKENTWYHVVATYDNSLSRTGIKLYVNNVQLDIFDIGNATIADTYTYGHDLQIGYSPSSNSHYLQGKLSQLVLLPEILNEVNMNHLYNLGEGRKYGN